MARLVTASCRLCRREGEKLFLKGARCTSDKCALLKREYTPGMHGQGMQKKRSNYAIQLREKQKTKRIYGILERQFKNYFRKAERTKMVTGEALLQFLERRLDNVVYRACFAESRSKARQLVSHRFAKINGKRVTIPSHLVSVGDEIKMVGNEKQAKAFLETYKNVENRGIPEWMEVSSDSLTIKIKRLPARKDVAMPIQESLIVELYSK